MPCYDSLMVLVTVWQQSARREEEEEGEREKVREWKRKTEVSQRSDSCLSQRPEVQRHQCEAWMEVISINCSAKVVSVGSKNSNILPSFSEGNIFIRHSLLNMSLQNPPPPVHKLPESSV